ncbi:hypothetical protein BDV97DRAFT_370366 [Delphinella strobiligena]|nr:hypothetical protein BDV97DRAFT_370366 [Delphinella strobiligena]
MVPYLPDEILLHIFTNCCSIAQPLLFCTFDRRLAGTTLYNLHDNLPLFLRTLIEQPRLVVQVRHVKLKSWEYDDDYEPEPATPPLALSLTLAPTYQSAVANLPLSLSTKSRLVASFANGSDDAEVALLVALCPNLETLIIGVEGGVETSLLLDLARESLQSMQTVQPMESHDFRILKVPARTAPRGIARILTSCPNLQTISTQQKRLTDDGYSMEYPAPEYTDEYSQIEWHNIGKVLRKHGRTLQTLRLSPLNICEIEETDPEAEEEPEVIFPLGNVEPLNALKHLTAPQFALLGQDHDSDEDCPHFAVPCLANILPKSLESLGITHCSNDTHVLDKAILELIADSRFPKLERVCIERKTGHLDFDIQNAAWDENIEHWNDWYAGSLRMICRERVITPVVAL